MGGKLRIAVGLIIVCFFVLSAPSLVLAGDPTDEIRVVIDRGIEVLEDPKLKGDDKEAQRVDRLREIVTPLFDFTEMARRSLGQHWRRRSPEEQREFVRVFTEFLENSYAGKIDLYRGERVAFTRETVEKDYAQVDSKVVAKTGEEYSVTYKLLRVDGKWKIYDVVVENISLVNNYRSQFNRVITNSSYEELVKKMKKKTG